jgi:hypothetical protein
MIRLIEDRTGLTWGDQLATALALAVIGAMFVGYGL